MHKSIMTEELEEFRQLARTWLKQEVSPHYAEWEKAGKIPREIYARAGKQGFLCLTQSQKYGGLGLDFRFSAVMIEEVARIGASGLAFFLHSDIVAPYIENYGTEDQKKKYLPKMASGEFIGAIAMTEPNAGSDLQAVTTSAKKQGSNWIINGQKTFISNGHCSDVIVVVAKTESPKTQKYARQSLFIVESSSPGFQRGKLLQKIGLKAQDTAELFFQDCRVPDGNLLGQEGEAFKYLMQQLGRERICMAIWCVAQAQGVLEETIQYCKERKAFGQSISDFQNTKYRLAELDTEISLGEAFVDRCILEMAKQEDLAVSASKAKYWCSEMLGRVVDQCLQFYGGYGYMEEYAISRAYVDARVQRIFGGTTEIMKEVISRDLLKGRA